MNGNEKEKDIFYDWSVKHIGQYNFPVIEKESGSYFVKREDTDYLMEYKFETVTELKECLAILQQKGFLTDEIIKPLIVAAMKNKPEIYKDFENTEKSENTDAVSKEKLPDYIYNL